MTRRMVIPALLLAGLGLGAYALAPLWTSPDPAIDDYSCTTCDARQAAKKRLSDHLRSLPDPSE